MAWWVDKGIPKGGIRDSRRGDRGRERGQEGGDNDGYRGFVHRGVAGGGYIMHFNLFYALPRPSSY